MNYNERRDEILNILKDSDTYVNAATLAEKFGVTRQIIVSDIAIIRAAGYNIIATRKGYALNGKAVKNDLHSVVCKHSEEQTAEEFYAVVDNGGVVVNVIVEHPLYGELSADLNIASRYDANEFIKREKKVGAIQLCNLTDGLHVHMLRVPDEAALERIKSELSALGVLAE